MERNVFGDENIYLKTIDIKHIRRIIFGWKVLSKDVERISIELKKISPGINFVAAFIKDGKIIVPN
jgi:hypothetical protein